MWSLERSSKYLKCLYCFNQINYTMKILKYIFGILLLLFIGFILLGVFKPSVEYKSAVTVDKSANEVWAVMQDTTKLSEWLSGFQKSELVSGTYNTVGAVSNIYFIENGAESIIQETITALDPGKKMAMDFHIDSFMDMEYEMLLDESNGKTSITATTKAKGLGLWQRSMVAMMGGAMQKQEDINMDKLKNIVNNSN